MKEIYKALMNEPEAAIMKYNAPEGKCFITLIADPDIANDIVRLAKQQGITVVDSPEEETTDNQSPFQKAINKRIEKGNK